jgi:hypothetical protein
VNTLIPGLLAFDARKSVATMVRLSLFCVIRWYWVLRIQKRDDGGQQARRCTNLHGSAQTKKALYCASIFKRMVRSNLSMQQRPGRRILNLSNCQKRRRICVP